MQKQTFTFFDNINYRYMHDYPQDVLIIIIHFDSSEKETCACFFLLVS